MGLSLEQGSVAVCGANGNIGSVYARLLAAASGSLMLVGRGGSELRLQSLAAEVASELATLYGRGIRSDKGLFGRFAQAYERIDAPPPHFEGLLPLLEKALGCPLVDLHEDLSALRAADVIV